jgi:hypothetical protein
VFFVFSSPEAMAEADAVIENLLKVWGTQSCSLLLRVQSAHDSSNFKIKGRCFVKEEKVPELEFGCIYTGKIIEILDR